MDEKEKVELLEESADKPKKEKHKKQKKEKAPKEEKPRKTDEEKSETKKKIKSVFISVIIVAGLVLGMVFGPSLYLKLRDKDGFDFFGDKNAKATVLIYMLGADAKSQNATDDLNEIINSGVDLNKSNVVVYKSDGKHNSISELNINGFFTVNTLSPASMGESSTLTQFLNYGFENYKADEISLVIWDHSENQLTLEEVCDALYNSQFKGENKLSWIGFDASFMASAEAACMLSDYADFLVASQEVTTYFGWDYSFLKHLGISDTKVVLDELATAYSNACKTYFEALGIAESDTNISCIDLSLTQELEEAIDLLFKVALDNLEADYNKLAFARANTRGVGRVNMGVETDLVDVWDMAEKLLTVYPVEAKILQFVVEEMVITNECTADGLSGLSMYYPFFNKVQYENIKDAYAGNSLFANYKSYLEKYAEIWLQNDKVSSIVSVPAPTLSTINKYTLELDQAQQENFAMARYYVLIMSDENVYTPIYTSSSIENNNGVLTADFDGNIIYAKDNYNKYIIPVVRENDSVNNITRYSVLGSVNDSRYSNSFDGVNVNTQNCRYNLYLNTLTENVTMGSIVPCNDNFVSDARVGNLDLTPWTTYCLPQNKQFQLVRNGNGVIAGVSDWQETSSGTVCDMPIGDGLEFVYEPLTSGEYYIMFEITDTQGNKYCSEMLKITQTHEMENENIAPQEITTTWENGEEVLLFSQNNVDAYLTTIEVNGKEKYAYKFVNNNAYPVFVESNGAVLNGEIIDNSAFNCSEYIPANSTVVMSESLTFSNASFSTLKSATFVMYIRNADTKTTLVYNQAVTVNFSTETGKYFK